MAKWIVGKGLDHYIAYLQRLDVATDEIVGKAVYEMAKIVADNVKANMLALPAVSNEANIATYKKGYSRLSEPEKEGLIEGFGISPMQNDQGYVNVKLRFLYKGIIIKHNKTEPTYTKTSLFLCEKRRFFMARTEKGVVATI